MDLKGALIPPLIALAIYLLVLYFCLPLYRQRQFYSQYLPISLPAAHAPGFVTRTHGRIQEAAAEFFGNRIRWVRRGSAASADFNFGDEELEEGFGTEHLPRNAEDRDVDRRLSRDLEAGFRDDSDDDGEDERRRGGRNS